MQDWYAHLKDLVIENISKYSVEKYFVGVSGGRDSVFLIHLLKDLLPIEKIVVLHMNHCLRGEFSDQDQVFVEELAKNNGLACYSSKVNLDLQAGAGGLENIARMARYQWFQEQMKSVPSVLFCGHTLDDHLETIIMKLHRGSGLAGLKGIAMHHEVLGVKVCRPLIYTERQQITNYLNTHHMNWCDDHTNLSAEYFRNEVRLNLIPQLLGSTKQRIVKLSALSSSLQLQFEIPEATLIAGGLEFNYSDIDKLSLFEVRYLIEKIFHCFGLSSGPDKKHMDRIHAFLQEKKLHLQLPNFINVYYSHQKVFFHHDEEKVISFDMEFSIFKTTEVIRDENNLLSLKLPMLFESEITWRFVDFSRDLWKGRPFAPRIKKVKIPPWRKKLIPLCEYQEKVLFVAYLGVTENYHNLISGGSEFVTIEVLNLKVKL